MAPKSRIIMIYALVDPETHLVRYAGQTTRLASRYKEHCSGAYHATARWVRSLNDDPQLVVLETVTITPVPGTSCVYVPSDTTRAETKWLKRFRRTVVNTKLRANSPAVWDALVNPPDVAKCG
jgi:hypothetical protein